MHHLLGNEGPPGSQIDKALEKLMVLLGRPFSHQAVPFSEFEVIDVSFSALLAWTVNGEFLVNCLGD